MYILLKENFLQDFPSTDVNLLWTHEICPRIDFTHLQIVQIFLQKGLQTLCICLQLIEIHCYRQFEMHSSEYSRLLETVLNLILVLTIQSKMIWVMMVTVMMSEHMIHLMSLLWWEKKSSEAAQICQKCQRFCFFCYLPFDSNVIRLGWVAVARWFAIARWLDIYSEQLANNLSQIAWNSASSANCVGRWFAGVNPALISPSCWILLKQYCLGQDHLIILSYSFCRLSYSFWCIWVWFFHDLVCLISQIRLTVPYGIFNIQTKTAVLSKELI